MIVNDIVLVIELALNRTYTVRRTYSGIVQHMYSTHVYFNVKVNLMMGQCLASVVDGGPTLI